MSPERKTVYRSPLVRMLPELVGLFPVERACIKLDVFFGDLKSVINEYAWESLKYNFSIH